jgi:hypothetical protein
MLENSENSSKGNDIKDSFLREGTFSSGIRNEVELKFKNSKSKKYKFPRKEPGGMASAREIMREGMGIVGNKLEKKQDYSEIYKVYTREAESLNKMRYLHRLKLFGENKHKRTLSSKNHLRNQSSPYRLRSPLKNKQKFSVYLPTSSDKQKKNNCLRENTNNYFPIIKLKPTSHLTLENLIQKTRNHLLTKKP